MKKKVAKRSSKIKYCQLCLGVTCVLVAYFQVIKHISTGFVCIRVNVHMSIKPVCDWQQLSPVIIVDVSV